MSDAWRIARITILSVFAGFLALHAVPQAAAQDYPERRVDVVVGFSPGGGTDLTARLISKHLEARLGQAFVVENRTGASGTIAAQAVANAEPDGYTILFIPIAHAANAGIRKNIPYDTVEDFAPISLIGSAPSAILVNPSVPGETLEEFIAAAKERPGEFDYASSGHGSSAHLAAALFALEAGVELGHIPYKGGGEALTGLLSGEVDLHIASVPSAVSHIEAGGVKVLAVTSRTRSSALPDVPTAIEAGLPGYEYGGWYGLVAPAGTPDEVVQKIAGEIDGILQEPEVVEFMKSSGAEPIGSSPAEFKEFLRAEVEKWRRVAEAAGIQEE
jgi:tripartite-type tricarboxylate transporter receptor subunit TctC